MWPKISKWVSLGWNGYNSPRNKLSYFICWLWAHLVRIPWSSWGPGASIGRAQDCYKVEDCQLINHIHVYIIYDIFTICLLVRYAVWSWTSWMPRTRITIKKALCERLLLESFRWVNGGGMVYPPGDSKCFFLGWLSDPFKGLSDRDEKVTLNHLACVFKSFTR